MPSRPAVVVLAIVATLFAWSASAAAQSPVNPMGAPLKFEPASAPRGPATPDLIQRALDAGRIDLYEATKLRIAALRGRTLPKAYRSEAQWDGTPVVTAVGDARTQLSSAQVAELDLGDTRTAPVVAAQADTPPPRSSSCGTNNSGQLDHSLLTEHFFIEYSATGSKGLSITEYGDKLEAMYNRIVTEFGWTPAPVHPTLGGRYSVRVVDLNPGGVSEGQTVTMGFVANFGTYADGNTLTCMVLNTRAEDFVDPMGEIGRTSAHEYTHSIQNGLGIVGALDPSFVEGGADWMAQEVLDGYVSHSKLFPRVAEPLAEMGFGGGFEAYKSWFVIRGLTERFGVGVAGGGEQVIEDMYEAIAAGSVGQMGGLRLGIANKGKDLAEVYADFGIAAKFLSTCDVANLADDSGRCLRNADAYSVAPAQPGFTGGHLALSSANGFKVAGGIKNDYATQWVKLAGSAATYGVTVLNKATNVQGRIRGTVVCASDAGAILDLGSITTLAPGATGKAFVDKAPCGLNPLFLVLTSEDSGSEGNPGTPATLDFEVSTGAVTTQTLTVLRGGAGTGTVTSRPTGVACGTACTVKFVSGNTVVLRAAASAATSGFSGWSGCDSVSGSDCTVTMSGPRTVTASFADETTTTLTTNLSGPGADVPGSVKAVTPADPAFTCAAATCTRTYRGGVAVRLRPDSENGFKFSGWTGCAREENGDCFVTMDGSKAVTATFTTALKVVPAKTLVSTIAGAYNTVTGAANYEDDVPATAGYLSNPHQLARAANGDWLVMTPTGIRRFAIGGNIRTIVGKTAGFGGSGQDGVIDDGAPATSDMLNLGTGMAPQPDGTLLVVAYPYIRRLELDGTLGTFAATPPGGLPGEINRLADGTHLVNDLVVGMIKYDTAGKYTPFTRTTPTAWGAAVRPDGSMMTVATTWDQDAQKYSTKRLLSISATGEPSVVIAQMPGAGKLRFLPDGSLLMADSLDGFVYRIVGTKIYKIAGIPKIPNAVHYNGEGKPADETAISASDAYPFDGGIVLLEGDLGKVRLIDKTSILNPPATPTTAKSVSIDFASLQLDSAVTTECSLDGGAWSACSSPYTATVADGDHTFRVRATDALGTDPTPAEAKWHVGTEHLERNVTVTKDGQGTGTVTAPGIDCGSDCAQTYLAGDTVTLTATPAAGSSFAGFSSRQCTSSTPTCTFTVGDQDLAVVAYFVLGSSTPTGGGTTQPPTTGTPTGPFGPYPTGYTPPGTTAPGGLPAAGAPGLTGPASLKASVLAGIGAAFTLTCGESCAVTYTLKLDSRTAKRLKLKNPVGKGSGVAAAGKPKKLLFTVAKKARAKMKKAKGGTVTVTVKVEDAAGDTTTLKKTIKLK